MYVNIDEILKKQNKTRFWLSKEVGFHYQSLCKLCANETTSISFEHLQKICIALNCGVEDVLLVEEE